MVWVGLNVFHMGKLCVDVRRLVTVIGNDSVQFGSSVHFLFAPETLVLCLLLCRDHSVRHLWLSRCFKVIVCGVHFLVTCIVRNSVATWVSQLNWILHWASCSQEFAEALSILNKFLVKNKRVTLAIRSVGSLKGSLFQLTFSALSPFRLTIPFSQLAQSTGPTYFLVNIASSSVVWEWLFYKPLIKSWSCLI